MMIIESVGYNITIEISTGVGNDFYVNKTTLDMLKTELEPELAFHEDIPRMEIAQYDDSMTITFLEVHSEDINGVIKAYNDVIKEVTKGEFI